ncbi:SMC family protein [Psychrobacter fozii]|uniref:hypothetical protein n=1 Tax=Psychrobacter fozii TaxID=198480 RepID=UPI001919623C|nr:hypothetical protein [Psychrobacter fozii]
MNKYGFIILKLTLVGKDIPDAEINFKRGVNVITGASNTGKSFILNCIDYMFGAGETPKNIPEAKPYDSIFLTIESNNENKKYHLKRSLHKFGVITVSTDNIDGDFILQPKLDSKSDKDSISLFLLRLSGLEHKKVRKNLNNVTDNLSFRDISHLCVIPEEKIITESSPIFTSNGFKATKEKSVFSLLLTGKDDSNLISTEEKKLSNAKKAAKIELLEELIQNTSNNKENSRNFEIEDQIKKLDLYYGQLKDQLKPLKSKITLQENSRNILWEEIQYLNSHLNSKNVLLERFELLEKKYNSDLERLDSTIEANSIFDNLPSIDCFFCEAIPEHQNKSVIKSYDSNIVELSCLQESNSIKTLREELILTMSGVKENIYKIKASFSEKKLQLALIENEIEQELKPYINKTINLIESTQNAIFEKKSKLKDIERIDLLRKKLFDIDQLVEDRGQSNSNNSALITNGMELICKDIEDRLLNWNLFDNEHTRVTFNYESKVWDFIIAGQGRGAYGKGVRALTYTAFSLSLLNYCVKQSKPYSGLLLIDSPLVAFKERKLDIVNTNQSIKFNFFNDVLSTFKNQQVIIFENVDIPENLKKYMHIIEFSGNKKIGRYGFIPMN